MINLTHNYFLYMFISVLYTFRAFKCSSSRESIVSIRYLVYVTLCRCPSGMQIWTKSPTPPYVFVGLCLTKQREECKRGNIILFNDQLDAQFFFVYVYFNSLHVSTTQVRIIRRFNCINTISGICHSM